MTWSTKRALCYVDVGDIKDPLSLVTLPFKNDSCSAASYMCTRSSSCAAGTCACIHPPTRWRSCVSLRLWNTPWAVPSAGGAGCWAQQPDSQMELGVVKHIVPAFVLSLLRLLPAPRSHPRHSDRSPLLTSQAAFLSPFSLPCAFAWFIQNLCAGHSWVSQSAFPWRVEWLGDTRWEKEESACPQLRRQTAQTSALGI